MLSNTTCWPIVLTKSRTTYIHLSLNLWIFVYEWRGVNEAQVKMSWGDLVKQLAEWDMNKNTKMNEVKVDQTAREEQSCSGLSLLRDSSPLQERADSSLTTDTADLK